MTDIDRADVETLSVGERVEIEVSEALERRDFVRYAGASGDFNPLHVDENHARKAGYDSVFGHGMLVCGYVAQVVSGWIGIRHVSDLEVRFVSKARPGDAVIVRCEITGRKRREARTVVEMAIEAVDGTGRMLAEGTANGATER